MAIDSAISSLGVLKVSLRQEGQARQDQPERKDKKKRATESATERQPVPYQRGQTMGIVIDISV